MQSLVRISFGGSSKQLMKVYYTQIFFPPIRESFLLQKFPALQHVFGPNRYQHLSIPLLDKPFV